MNSKLTTKPNSLYFYCLLLLCTVSFMSCENSKDPLKEKALGSNPQELEKSLITQNILSYNQDSIGYFKIGDKNSKLKSTFQINPEYDFEKVQAIDLNFGSDSLFFSYTDFTESIYTPGEGQIKRDRIDSVLSFYSKWYGDPKYEFKSSKSYSNVYSVLEEIPTKDSIKNEFDLLFPPTKTYHIWEQEDFRLMISYNAETDTTFDTSLIRYESTDYKDILNKKKEEVRKNAKPEDLVKIGQLHLTPFSKADAPYTDQMNLSLGSISHTLIEEPRRIKKFRFNLTLLNEYEDVLLSIEDLDFEPTSPLQPPIGRGLLTSNSINNSYWIAYNRYSEKSKDYEKVRLARERNWRNIKLKYKITAVIFEDGEVVK